MGEQINGKLVASSLREELKNFVKERVEKNLRIPCMCSVLVGNDGGSISYINNQKRVCEEVGVLHRSVFLKEDASEEEVISTIEKLNTDSQVDGIMLQVPLPSHLDETKITSRISYLKDIDGLTFENTGRLYKGEQCFTPCTPQSVVKLIKSTGITIEGKSAVVIGRSTIVGKPAAELLIRENATVTVCHSRTKNLQQICSNADILVCALGKPGFVTKDFIKEGAVVIDVGTTMVNGKLKGDVQYEEAIEKAAYVTPVPGGVGALTTTILIKNTCEALERNVY